jgi:hypothetical protein
MGEIMSQQLQVLWELKINPGKADELRSIASDLVAFIEPGEPRTIACNVYINKEESLISFKDTFADGEAFIVHSENFASSKFGEQILERTNDSRLCIYGNPPQTLKDMLSEAGYVVEWFNLVDGYFR